MSFIKINDDLYSFMIDSSSFYVSFSLCGDVRQISFALMNNVPTKKSMEVFSTINDIFNEYSDKHQNINKYVMFIITKGESEEGIQRRISIFQRWFNRQDKKWEFTSTNQELGGRLKGATTILMSKK